MTGAFAEAQLYTIPNVIGLNIRASIESGQPLTFHANYKLDDGTERLDYVTQDGVIRLQRERARPDALLYSFAGNYTRSSARDEIASRFGLSHDMRRIYSRIRTDRFMDNAVSSLYGMRVTENHPWEATLCYLISQFNNIKRIRGIVRGMISRFGDTVEQDGIAFKLFPSPERISKASINELMACGTGFRAKYIKNTARAFSENPGYAGMHGTEYGELKNRLMDLDGVGDKVADCILLFGYRKHMAFPIDVWIKRVVEEVYFDGRKQKISEIHGFADRKWGSYAGYAQQYLFESGRRNRIGVRNDKGHR